MKLMISSIVMTPASQSVARWGSLDGVPEPREDDAMSGGDGVLDVGCGTGPTRRATPLDSPSTAELSASICRQP